MNPPTSGPIKDFALGIYDGPHATPAEASEGPVFLGIKNVSKDGRLLLSDIRHVSEQEFPKWTRRVTPQESDIVFSYEATLHRYALIPDGFSGCLGRRMALVRPDTTKVNPRFLHYYFLTPLWRARVEAIVINGATVDRIPLTNFPDLSIDLPSLHIQERIADKLRQYDDLIENNRRRIQLLEQAARLLYKEWFVHLRFPGHEHAKITDGVPEGWEKTTIGSVSTFLSRGITPKYDNEATGLVINQKCIRHRMVNLDLARRQSQEPPVPKLVRFGDVLINSTGAGTLGRVAQYLFDLEDCTVDSHVTIVRPVEDLPVHFFGMHLANMESYIATLGRGATNQTELSRDSISELPILDPSKAIGAMYEDVVSNLFRQIRIIAEQNRKLSDALDLLLPRLMNGEITA